MLQQKTTTKREKKKAIRKKMGLFLIIIGLLFIVISLFSIKFLTHGPLFVSPLSGNQDSVVSILEKELKKNKIAYIGIQTNDDLSYIVKLNEKEEVIIDPKKDILSQLSSLQLIASQLKIEGKTFLRLDFRYKKPVITF